MINVPEMIKKAMKKELFNTDELNLAARQILGEMKTKFVDIKEEITNEIQYKMLIKMKKDRENSIKIYTEAYEKTGSKVAEDNLIKAKNELEPINMFINELESSMPKKLNEEEIKKVIEDFLANNENPNKGMIMKYLKNRGDVEMSIAAKIISFFHI